MKADTVLTAVVALCCVFAIGATSTTLDSTVSTDPEEVTEFDYEKIPIGTGAAQNLDDAIDGDRSGSEESGSASDDSRSESESRDTDAKSNEDGARSASASKPGDGEQTGRNSESSDSGERGQRSGSSEQQRQSAASGERRKQASGASDSKSGPGRGVGEPSLLQRLLWLLRDLFDLLLSTLPYAVLVAALAVAVRYRDRLRSRFGPHSSDGTSPDGSGFEPTPENEVASAWFEMVERLDLADRRDLTPRECAAAARRRGVDGDAARRLTALFEEVRYGGAGVTDERRRRAEENLREVQSQLEDARSQLEEVRPQLRVER